MVNGQEDQGIELMLAAARNVKSTPPPTTHYDEEHDLWTVFFRSGRHNAVVVDEFLTVFEDDEQRIIGVQISNLRKVKDCLGPSEIHWGEQGKISLIRLVLQTFALTPDGVEPDAREKLYFRTATQLAEVGEIQVTADVVP